MISCYYNKTQIVVEWGSWLLTRLLNPGRWLSIKVGFRQLKGFDPKPERPRYYRGGWIATLLGSVDNRKSSTLVLQKPWFHLFA